MNYILLFGSIWVQKSKSNMAATDCHWPGNHSAGSNCHTIACNTCFLVDMLRGCALQNIVHQSPLARMFLGGKQKNPSEDTTEIGHQRALICINPRWPPKWPPDPWFETNFAYISGSRPHSFMILGSKYMFSGSIYPMDIWPWPYKVKVTLQGQGHHDFWPKLAIFD